MNKTDNANAVVKTSFNLNIIFVQCCQRYTELRKKHLGNIASMNSLRLCLLKIKKIMKLSTFIKGAFNKRSIAPYIVDISSFVYVVCTCEMCFFRKPFFFLELC